MQEMPAYNVRLGASGAVTPQTILCGIERYYPAAGLVEAPPAPSRWDVRGNARATVQLDKIKNAENENNIKNNNP